MTATVGTVVTLTVLCIVFAVLFRVIFMLALNIDCREQNFKSTTLFTVLAFFFPIITGAIYAALRKKEKLAKKSVTLFIISAVIFALCICTGICRTVAANKITTDISDNYTDEEIDKSVDKILEEYSKKQSETTAGDSSGKEQPTVKPDESEAVTADVTGNLTYNLTYYDRDGKAYKSPIDVPFYDKDGNRYFCKQNNNLQTWYVKEGDSKKLESLKCFVDKDGYFFYDEKGELTLSADKLTAKDKSGNAYSPAALVIWTKDGTMISSIN
ncbi:MAG: hypothetical protein IJ235_07900 [Eubacterium sp.]|nr:hypothetical protein [Eubacterium sp.]MBQ8981873.1 hypothetical protein [Eubacterium sp.]MBR2278369.1 hypothetical protein [Eubacterium sp.]